MAAGLSFRPLAEDDLAQLAAWLAAPHVERWWRAPSDVESVRAKYVPRITGEEPTEVFVIESGGRAVGIIQRYRLAAYPGWRDALAVSGVEVGPGAGLDYLVGEADLVGRGLGSAAIDAFTAGVFADWPDVARVVVAPQLGNRASCRALEKAGYRLAWHGMVDSEDASDTDESAVYVRER